MAPHSSSVWHHEATYILLFCLLITLVKPLEKNSRYIDEVMTTPKGTLFSMSGMSLAFERELIGPAMYFGLMGHGQPIGGYDNMWAGWCAKVICDHMGWGVKTGLPYVWRWHVKASNRYSDSAQRRQLCKNAMSSRLSKLRRNFERLILTLSSLLMEWSLGPKLG